VEAIALILLHRHPLSTRRAVPPPAPPPQQVEPPGLQTPKGKGKSKAALTPKNSFRVPVIDLHQGVPDVDSGEIKRWCEAEKAAFEGRKAWDEASQLHVAEVAVRLPIKRRLG